MNYWTLDLDEDMNPCEDKSNEDAADPDFFCVLFQNWSPQTHVPFPFTEGHVTVQSGGSHTTPSPRGAKCFLTAAVGGMRTTSLSAKAASPSASKAEGVWLHDWYCKCAFHSFLVEESKCTYVTLFRCSSQEEDHPNKEEKYWLHCKPLNLKTINLCSHQYLCLYFRFFGFTVLFYCYYT